MPDKLFSIVSVHHSLLSLIRTVSQIIVLTAIMAYMPRLFLKSVYMKLQYIGGEVQDIGR